MSLDLNPIFDGAVSAYHFAYSKAVDWYGRSLIVLKSGAEIAMPYLQDKRVAIVALIAVNLILIELSRLPGLIIKRLLPNQTDGQQNFTDAVEVSLCCGLVFSGVFAFSKMAKLTLNWQSIVVISVATVFFRAYWTPGELITETVANPSND